MDLKKSFKLFIIVGLIVQCCINEYRIYYNSLELIRELKHKILINKNQIL